jgi:hypothetical protein
MRSPLHRAFGGRLQRRTPLPISGQARPRRRSCRASSTTCTAASGDSPRANPPRPPGDRGGDVEVAPGRPHRLVAAAVDEVGAIDPVAVAEEHVVAVPLVHPKIDVEAVRDSVPGISQPIFAFRRAMSACDAREADTRVVSRAFRWATWATWSAQKEQPRQA